MAHHYKEFNQDLGEKSWWLRTVEQYEREARRFGFFDLACTLQDGVAVLTREGSTRRDFRCTLTYRGQDLAMLRDVQNLDQMLKDEILLEQTQRLPAPLDPNIERKDAQMTWWQRNRFVVFLLIGGTPANIAWMWPCWWLGFVITIITAVIILGWDAWIHTE